MKQFFVTVGILFILLVTASQALAATTINGTVLGSNNLAVVEAEVSVIILYEKGIFRTETRADAATKTGTRGGFSLTIRERIPRDSIINSRIIARKFDKTVRDPLDNLKVEETNSIRLKFDDLLGTHDPRTGQPSTGGATAPAGQPGTGAGTGSPAGTGGGSAGGTPTTQSGRATTGGTAGIGTAPSGGVLRRDVIVGEGAKVPKGELQTLADRLKGDQPVAKIWRLMLNITNGVVILVFLVMGFATIFSVQVDTYGVKKALPNVIIAIILANFSLFITRMVVDVANILIVSIVNSQGGTSQMVEKMVGSFIQGGFNTLADLVNKFGTTQTGYTYAEAIGKIVFFGALLFTAGGYLILGAVLLAALAIIVPSVFILILAVLFYVRTYVILALAAVAPLAFISFALPATQVLFRQWWTQLVRWAMLGPIAFFLIWLAIEFSSAFSAQYEFGIYLVMLTMLYLAISLPFKMGGVITANVGKYLGKPLRQAAGFGARWYGRTSDVLSGQLSSRIGGRPITLMGLYKGWSANADRYYQRHVAKASGEGEDIREAVTSGAMGLMPWNLVRGGAGRFKRAFNILRTGERYQQAVQKQVTSEAQQITALSGESVAGGLAEALQHKDHQKAAQYLVAKAMQGQNVQEDFDKIYAAGLHKRPELKTALSTAQIEAAKNSNLAVNPADGDGAARKAHDVFKRNNGNKPQNQLETIMNRFIKEMEGNPGINESNIARYQFIEEYGSDKFKQQHDAELEPFRASVEIADVDIPDKEIQAAQAKLKTKLTGANLDQIKTTFELNYAFGGGHMTSQIAGLKAMENLKAAGQVPSAIQGHIDQILKDYATHLNAYANRGPINSWIRRSASGRWGGLTTPPPEEEIKIAKELVANPQVMLGLRFNREQVLGQARREIETINAEMGRLVAGQKQFDLKTVINLQSQVRGKLSATDFNKITGQLNRMRLVEESVMHPRQILEKYQGKVKGIKELLAKLH